MAAEKEATPTPTQTEADMPPLEETDIPPLVSGDATAAAANAERKETRSEKKSKKAMAKLGLKAVPNASRVTLKKGKNPDVYKNPNNDTWIIFGEAKVEDPSASALAGAARQLQEQGIDLTSASDAADIPALVPAAAGAADEKVDEAGIEPNDIELVVSQTGATRAAAVKAIREADGDIVNAIMALTK